ncbi:hypothetical protein AMAG_15760 [Allomyces macrogynus ATCC 38327]|uniref:Uncharacterized protein n=1 Tax=Allomyces macrogynus (strain ATCC 38327) TaxID=578462 RepID=A0A0L0T9S0_ALLM3|nr:hypothetical protein AMAG_15760 [Allomyces macrogynus ATCC 38327]|eukprot:KNE71548.1 hypothetical protein AMAG_15760 [Allomyces macrogynus ATCC 38327]
MEELKTQTPKGQVKDDETEKPYTIETNATGHPVLAWHRGNDSDVDSPIAYLSVDNLNIYPIKVIAPQINVNAPAAPRATIASAIGVWRAEFKNGKQFNVVSVSSGGEDLVKLRADISWNLTDEVSSRVLTKGLLNCGLGSYFLPPRLVVQAKDPNLDSALDVRVWVFMVMGVFVRAKPMQPTEFQRPAKDLICPQTGDSSNSTSRALADALCRAWGDCEVDHQAAAAKAS